MAEQKKEKLGDQKDSTQPARREWVKPAVTRIELTAAQGINCGGRNTDAYSSC